MEVLLRFQDRSTPKTNERIVVNSRVRAISNCQFIYYLPYCFVLQNKFESFQNTQKYPYDSTNPYEFKTNFASNFHELVSHSAKKYIIFT